ncbi:MAG: hypothetical protein OEM97_10415 [Acidimicrobiia bacterium]|nr:hypothetical protein [Acidimicrobiia bacterium]
MQTFTGLMDTSEQAVDNGFRVKVYMMDEAIEVATFDGDCWKWDTNEVRISRVKTDRFRMDLGDEALFFLPDDPLSFMLQASESPVETSTANQAKRGWLRRRIAEAATNGARVDAPSYVPEPQESPAAGGRYRRRGNHSHIWEATATAGVNRRRCIDCGYISIDLSSMNSALEDGALSA